GAGQRAAKWARRSRALAALVAAIVVLTVVGFILVTWKWLDAEDAREGEQIQRQLAEDRAKAEREAKQAAEREKEKAEQALEEVQISLYLHQIALAERAWLANELNAADKILAACPKRFRHWEWHYLEQLCQGSRLTLPGHLNEAYAVAFSPAGRELATGDQSLTYIWDASTGRRRRTLEGHTLPVASLVYTSDGRRLVSAAWDKTIRLWDPGTGKLLKTLSDHDEGVVGVALAPGERELATASHDGTVKVWDLERGRCRFTYQGHTKAVTGVAYRPDGKRLASSSLDGTVHVWDPVDGGNVQVFRGHRGVVVSVAFDRDGSRIASSSEFVNPDTRRDEGQVIVWQALDGVQRFSLDRLPGGVGPVAFSRDGKLLAAAAAGDGDAQTIRQPELRLYDAVSGKEVQWLK